MHSNRQPAGRDLLLSLFWSRTSQGLFILLFRFPFGCGWLARENGALGRSEPAIGLAASVYLIKRQRFRIVTRAGIVLCSPAAPCNYPSPRLHYPHLACAKSVS